MTRVARRSSFAYCLGLASAVLATGQATPTRAQSGSDQPSFIDERRLPQKSEDEANKRQSQEAIERLKTESERLRQRLSAETEARMKAEEEAARKKLEEDQAKQAAEAKRKAEEEEARVNQAAEAKRKAEEEEAVRRKAEEEARARQAAEAKRKAEEEEAARRKAEQEEVARRKAEEETRARQAAEAKRKAEEEEAARRKAEQEEAARRKAEEETRARQAAEAKRKAEEEEAVRRKAEEETRARQAAEARRRADEEAARRKAEDEVRARDAAEAKRKAEDEEAQRRKAEEESRARQEAEAKRKAAAGSIAQRMSASGGTSCSDVQLNSKALPAGRIEINLKSLCLSGRNVTFTYASHQFVRAVGSNGELQFVLDLFEGAAPLALKLPDGATTPVDLSGVDFKGVSKVAVLWSTPVNLDLHAQEYLASRGSPGHVWANSPGSLDQSQAAARDGNKARGFIGMSDDGQGEGTHAEVYSFLHNPNQRNGSVTLIIDYETRGDVPSGRYCGDGDLARIEVQVVRLRPGGRVEKETVRFGAVPCGQKVPEATRFNRDLLGDLVARG